MDIKPGQRLGKSMGCSSCGTNNIPNTLNFNNNSRRLQLLPPKVISFVVGDTVFKSDQLAEARDESLRQKVPIVQIEDE